MSIAGRLQYLANRYGDFKVARAWKDTKGEMHWTKHKSVLECSESEQGIQWLETTNNRQILPCEIILDIDEKPSIERMNWACDKLEILREEYRAYNTGSRGFHIHVFNKEFALYSRQHKEKLSKRLIQLTKTDLQKSSDKVLIAMEESPHWKTGKEKKMLRESSKWEY